MKIYEKLTVHLAKSKVDHIRSISNDDEAAHSTEDDLYYHFVKCISRGDYNKKEAIEVAKEILKTSKINFARWCA